MSFPTSASRQISPLRTETYCIVSGYCEFLESWFTSFNHVSWTASESRKWTTFLTFVAVQPSQSLILLILTKEMRFLETEDPDSSRTIPFHWLYYLIQVVFYTCWRVPKPTPKWILIGLCGGRGLGRAAELILYYIAVWTVALAHRAFSPNLFHFIRVWSVHTALF